MPPPFLSWSTATAGHASASSLSALYSKQLSKTDCSPLTLPLVSHCGQKQIQISYQVLDEELPGEKQDSQLNMNSRRTESMFGERVPQYCMGHSYGPTEHSLLTWNSSLTKRLESIYLFPNLSIQISHTRHAWGQCGHLLLRRPRGRSWLTESHSALPAPGLSSTPLPASCQGVRPCSAFCWECSAPCVIVGVSAWLAASCYCLPSDVISSERPHLTTQPLFEECREGPFLFLLVRFTEI